ncbi:MAG: hypothetical protein LUO93_07965 [Methanomicrobiales archaeon]|nr:hypothetical protein [Methanomicrobiales archaeon]
MNDAAIKQELLKVAKDFKQLKPKQRRFLMAYSQTHEILKSAELSGVYWRSHYQWLNNQQYKDAFEKAKEMYADLFEDQIMNATREGDSMPIIWNGVITGEYKRKSDLMRIAVLKGLKPQYRDSFNPAGAAAPITLAITYPGQPAEIDVTPPKKDD